MRATILLSVALLSWSLVVWPRTKERGERRVEGGERDEERSGEVGEMREKEREE